MKNGFNVKKAYIGLSSPYVVRNEFSGYARNFQTEYAVLPLEEKKKGKMFLKRKEKRGKGKENPVKCSSGTKSVQSF